MASIIKLGGSVITDKSKQYFVREDVIANIAEELRPVIEAGEKVALIHGGGSFGHVEAKRAIERYGKLDERSFAKISYAMMKLNGIITEIFFSKGIEVVSFPPHAFCHYLCDTGEFDCSYDLIKRSVDYGVLPLTFGDIVLTKPYCGAKIISGDDIAIDLAKLLKAEKIIFLTDVDGLYEDPDNPDTLIGDLKYSEINNVMNSILIKSRSIADVTEGLLGKLNKIESAFKQVNELEEVLIINGLKKGRLTSALLDKKAISTRIHR